MTDDRSDQLERLLVAIGQRVDSNARAIEANTASIQANTDSINALAEVAGRTLRAVDELRETVEEDRINFREFMNTTQSTLASINAAIERQDKILDYLIRRDQQR